VKPKPPAGIEDDFMTKENITPEHPPIVAVSSPKRMTKSKSPMGNNQSH